MDARERHLRLLTETIEAVNSTLDLEEVLSQVATKVADALHADACFVYLYDERTGELVLRATHGTSVAEMTQRPRMRPGEGITGSAAQTRSPVAISRQAHLDPRFKNFPNLPEDEYESILAVPILARGERLEGALNLRTREPREFTDDEIELLLASIAQQAAVALEHGRAVMRGVLAQEIHHRVKNNLQTVASLLRLQARATGAIDPQKALEDSVNRILAIAAVHELLTERRDDDVDLADLLGRLRAMLVQGVADGRAVDEALEPVLLAGHRATALALVFSELLGNALEHGGSRVHVDLHRDNGDVVLAISDDGRGIAGAASEGTGLSIVRALVRDELRGTFELSAAEGTRAEVRFRP